MDGPDDARAEQDWRDLEPVVLPTGAAVQECACLVLDPEPRNVSRARSFVTDHAPGLPDDTRDVLALLTSELVTNAVVHARTEVRLGVALTDADVVVTVHDLDLGRREAAGPERDGGRGLGMVEALAVACGQLRHRGGGKTAWFRLARHGAAT